MSHRKISVREYRLRRAVLAVCLLSFWGAGCGSESGPQRFELTGKVTYDGQPVASGEVLFAPDTAKGNKGPGAVAVIKDGTYQTTPGKGPIAGPHIVMLTGYASAGTVDPNEPEESGGLPPLLFSEYKTTAHISIETTTIDFDVPAQEN